MCTIVLVYEMTQLVFVYRQIGVKTNVHLATYGGYHTIANCPHVSNKVDQQKKMSNYHGNDDVVVYPFGIFQTTIPATTSSLVATRMDLMF